MKVTIRIKSYNNGTTWQWELKRESSSGRNTLMRASFFDESGKRFTSREGALADAEAFKASVAEAEIVVEGALA